MVVGSGNAAFSTNSGATWTTNYGVFGYPIACSADGTKALGAFEGPQIIISTNSGTTWALTGLPAALGQSEWRACASSTDGSRLAAAMFNGSIYTSTNAGTTWLTNTIATNEWESLAISADGTRLYASAYNDQIYTSTNMGSTWTPTGGPACLSLASSADGSHLITAGGLAYLSTNYGSSWTQPGVVDYFYTVSGSSVASSADGSRLIVVGDSQIFTSTDFGADWSVTNMPGEIWQCAASSADGGELLAGSRITGTEGGQSGIWIYQQVPSPEINITASGTGLTFSWLVPSTNLVLQQKADLTTTNWTTLTNVPTLDFFSLNNEITLSHTNSNGFFRLASP